MPRCSSRLATQALIAKDADLKEAEEQMRPQRAGAGQDGEGSSLSHANKVEVLRERDSVLTAFIASYPALVDEERGRQSELRHMVVQLLEHISQEQERGQHMPRCARHSSVIDRSHAAPTSRPRPTTAAIASRTCATSCR